MKLVSLTAIVLHIVLGSSLLMAEVPEAYRALNETAYSAPDDALLEIEARLTASQTADPWLDLIAARALYYSNRFSESLSRLTDVELILQQQSSPGLLDVMTDRMISQNYFRMGAMDQAMRHALNAQRLAESLQLLDEQAQISNLMAAVYLRTGEPDEARRAFEQALRHFESIGSLVDVAKLNNNLAALAIESGDLQQADQLLNEALRLARTEDRPSTLISALVNRIELTARLEQFDRSETVLAECLTTAQGSRQAASEVWCLEAGVDLFRRAGDLERAQSLAEQALVMASEQNMSQSMVTLNNQLIDLLEARELHAEALEVARRNLQQVQAIGDELIAVKLDEVTMLHNAEWTRSQLQQVQRQNDLQAERQFWLFVGLSVLLPLLAISIVLLRSKQALFRDLQQQQLATQQALQAMTDAQAVSQRLAVTDPLTGLYNRRELNRQLQHLLEDSDQPHCLLMLDIDRFKGINDRFGHHAGDRVLERVASMIRSSLPERCVAGRWGGEEFLVLCPNMTVETTRDAAEHLLGLLAAERVEVADKAISVTASIGISALEPDKPAEVSINAADEHLYLAKTSGRNRVCWNREMS